LWLLPLSKSLQPPSRRFYHHLSTVKASITLHAPHRTLKFLWPSYRKRVLSSLRFNRR
jgi:hypothetical protein